MFHGLGIDAPKLPWLAFLLSIEGGDMIDDVYAMHGGIERCRITEVSWQDIHPEFL
jgi:hypothetical protein